VFCVPNFVLWVDTSSQVLLQCSSRVDNAISAAVSANGALAARDACCVLVVHDAL
jgi:hypothetical protein